LEEKQFDLVWLKFFSSPQRMSVGERALIDVAVSSWALGPAPS
jgi:hypothetical protein